MADDLSKTLQAGTDVTKLMGIMEEFARDDVRQAFEAMNFAKTVQPDGAVVPIAFQPLLFNPVGVTPTLPSLVELSGTLAQLQTILPSTELQGLIERFKEYLKDPTQLATGVRSTGDRTVTAEKWKQSCRTEIGQDPDKMIPVKEHKVQWYVWDHIIAGEITTIVTLTWKSDKYNIYEADFALNVIRNDEPEDYSVLMQENYTIPAFTTKERLVCSPVTPKCLEGLASLTFYTTSATTGIPKGISKKIDIKYLMCPDDQPKLISKDLTAYRISQGDSNSIDAPQKPPVKPHDLDPNTWGVSRVDDMATDPANKYFPRTEADLK